MALGNATKRGELWSRAATGAALAVLLLAVGTVAADHGSAT